MFFCKHEGVAGLHCVQPSLRYNCILVSGLVNLMSQRERGREGEMETEIERTEESIGPFRTRASVGPGRGPHAPRPTRPLNTCSASSGGDCWMSSCSSVKRSRQGTCERATDWPATASVDERRSACLASCTPRKANTSEPTHPHQRQRKRGVEISNLVGSHLGQTKQ